MSSVDKKVVNINGQNRFREWFEEVYNDYFERLFRYAFSITKSKELAEDAVEEVFLNIWESKISHTEIKDLKNYLFVSIRNASVRLFSNDPARFSYDNYEEVLEVAETLNPEDLLLGNELNEFLAKTILNLPPHCKLIFDLVKNHGKSYEEASIEIGVSKKTVENQMSKAFSQIREQLDIYFKNSGSTVEWMYRIKIVVILFLLF